MVLVDTNIIVRYFIGQSDPQYLETEVFLERLKIKR